MFYLKIHNQTGTPLTVHRYTIPAGNVVEREIDASHASSIRPVLEKLKTAGKLHYEMAPLGQVVAEQTKPQPKKRSQSVKAELEQYLKRQSKILESLVDKVFAKLMDQGRIPDSKAIAADVIKDMEQYSLILPCKDAIVTDKPKIHRQFSVGEGTWMIQMYGNSQGPAVDVIVQDTKAKEVDYQKNAGYPTLAHLVVKAKAKLALCVMFKTVATGDVEARITDLVICAKRIS